MIDPFGRPISYLRVSVTDRCDFRCVYCMSEHMTFLPKAELLTLEEMERLCLAFVRKGVERLRITGGEPLVRRDVMRLFERLGAQIGKGGLKELTLTSNGSQLARFARPLAAAGVARINVSLDTLDPEKFRRITRWGDLSKVLAGIDAAAEAGLKVKINTVALRDVNETEIPALLEWAHGRGFDLTLIETMPMGEIDGDRVAQYLPLSLVRARLSETYLLEDSDHKTGGPARYVRVAETGGRLGFITPLTHNFCESCNRVRLTCTGTLFMCLGQDDAADLRGPLRASASDARLDEAIDLAIARKPKGHDFMIDRRHKNSGDRASHVADRRLSMVSKVHFVAANVPEAQAALSDLRARYQDAGPEAADVVVALGGDGFMLQTLHAFRPTGKPIYGMNLGSVGFLMNEYHPHDLHKRLAAAEPAEIHPLRMRAYAGGVSRDALAFNEVSLLRQTRQAAKIRVLVDDKPRIAELICDGILLSTPAGSTAYNLSAHGPILPIDAALLALTPISAFRPRRWRGALLPHRARVRFEVLEAAKRPVSAVADDLEVRDVTAVDIAQDRSVAMTMLFDAGHSLDERILAEQFLD